MKFSKSSPSLCPELAVVNASVRTMDPAMPRAEALAVIGNRFCALGSTEEIKAITGPSTRVLDAGGNTVLPGFNDAHVHFLTGGFSLSNVDLRDADSPEQMARRLADFAANVPEGTWILGGDWDHERWPGSPLPTRQQIDWATPRHPVLVTRCDEHMALANSLALRLAGVSSQTPDPPGGLLVRDAGTGELTGILKDAALSLVERSVPAKTVPEKLAAARAATAYAASLGVTSLTDMSAGSDVGLYQSLAEEGELKTRIYAAHSITSWEVLARAGVRAAFGNDLLRVGALKGFADGSLGTSTALFFEPYADAPESRGLLFDQMLPEGIMLERVAAADRHYLQVMIHAIGDEANARILDLYEAVTRNNGDSDRRFRIEHAQHLRVCDIRRFGAQRVIASAQPYHAADDGRWCEKRLGPARSEGAYPFRSLLDTGAVLAFGSDWTVAPLNPLLGLQAAVTRQTLDGKHPDGWIPQQKITLDEALHAYTVGSAYAEFTEHNKGTITPGNLADLVILDRDIHQAGPSDLGKAKVIWTVMDGRIVHDKT